jgi:RHS repeat-associated protein
MESGNTAALNTEKQYYDIQDGNITDEGDISAFNGATTNEYQNNNGNPPYNNNPSANASANSVKLYKLNGANGVPTGLGITLRVMSGDVVDIFGKSFYHSGGATPNNSYPVSGALLNLLNVFAGSAAVTATHTGLTGAVLNSNPGVTGPLSSWLNGAAHDPASGDIPKAFINWVFLDEQFNPVTTTMSGCDAVSSHNNVLKNHHQAVNITKNGYLYIYCSNESDMDVFFDNLQVIQTHGPLVEETHYYPFGLTMAGISSQALNFGQPENNKLYNKGSELQHKEFSDGSGLELYSTNFRSLDPQLGRWWQIDPKPDFAMSLYSAMGNNPILYNDPLGDTTNPRGQQLNINNQGMTSNSNITLNRIPKLERHPISTVNSIILHRTVSSSAASTLSSFASRGVGTHFLVGKDGTIYQTASLNSATSHLRESQIKKGFENIKNNTAIGIEVVGNYSENTKTWDAVTPEQASSTAFVVNSLEKTYSLTDDAIHNHEDVQPKTAGEGATVYKAIEPMLDSHNTITNDNQSSSGQYLSPHPSSLPAYFTNYLTPPNTDNN